MYTHLCRCASQVASVLMDGYLRSRDVEMAVVQWCSIRDAGGVIVGPNVVRNLVKELCRVRAWAPPRSTATAQPAAQVKKLELALEVFKVYGGYAAGPELLALLPPCDLRGHTVSLADDPVMYTELIFASLNDARLPLALFNEALNRGITPYTTAINGLLAVGAGALVLRGAHAASRGPCVRCSSRTSSTTRWTRSSAGCGAAARPSTRNPTTTCWRCTCGTGRMPCDRETAQLPPRRARAQPHGRSTLLEMVRSGIVPNEHTFGLLFKVPLRDGATLAAMDHIVALMQANACCRLIPSSAEPRACRRACR
jgi:hypothetical protein